MDTEVILDRLFQYYDVAGTSELAEKMNTTRQTITNWKSRGSINPIKKKCRELGIYNDIFGVGSQINNLQNSTISGAGVDNSQGSSHAYNTSSAIPINFPDYFIDELNTLFKRSGNKKEELIDALDDFIASQKKIYR
jgi:hypothetical protein